MTKNLLKIFLKPIASFCIRRSIKLQEFVDVFKDVLTIAAKEELERQAEDVNASRLSVMTGVHRKDVKQILSGTKPEDSGNIISRVIGQWLQDKRFTTKAGKPRVLSVEGADSEFADLVNSVSVDLNPYTVLFELERIAAVKRTQRGLNLEVSFYFPEDDLEGSYQLLAADLNDLISSVEENIHDQQKSKHLHLKTEYDKIPLEILPKIKDWILNEGSNFHEKLRKYISQHDADINKKACDDEVTYGRISVGTFGYSDDQKDS